MTRVLLVRLSAMGDVCQSLGAAQALQAARPDLELHFVTQTTFAPLLENLAFASVVTFDRSGGWRALREVRRKLRSLSADCAIDLQGNWKSALVARLSGAREVLGAGGVYRQAPASGWLLSRVAMAGARHPAAIAEQLLRRFVLDEAAESESEPGSFRPGVALTKVAAGGLHRQGPNEPGWLWWGAPRLIASDAEVAAAGRAVESAGIPARGPFTVFVVARPEDNRAWPIQAMQRQLALETDPVLWLVGPQEDGVELPADVFSLSQGPRHSRELRPIRELVALGALVAARGGRVYGPDVGATHVLAAAGARTRALFGPQDPQRTAPPAAEILLHPAAPDCRPCRSRRCTHSQGPVCMQFLPAEAEVQERN